MISQYYFSCAQIKVTGGGNGTPGPLVTIPGHLDRHDPILYSDLYSVSAVVSCFGGIAIGVAWLSGQD